MVAGLFWSVACLGFALTLSQFYTPLVQYDAISYLALANGTPELAVDPFCSRILTPFLAGLFADPKFGFAVINVVTSATAFMVLGVFLQRRGFTTAEAFVGQWLFLGGSGGIERLSYPYNVDAVDFLLLLVLLLLIEERRFWAACVMATVAALNKETWILFIPFWVVSGGQQDGARTTSWSWRGAAKAAAWTIPALLVLLFLRATTGKQLDASYFNLATVTSLWRSLWSAPTQAIYGWVYYLMRSWGIAWVLIIWGCTTGNARRWFSRYVWLAVPLLLPVFVITAPGRQYVLLFPILLPLACEGWRKLMLPTTKSEHGRSPLHMGCAVTLLLLSWIVPLLSLYRGSATVRHAALALCFVVAMAATLLSYMNRNSLSSQCRM